VTGPGSRIEMTVEQLRVIELWVARNDGRAGVSIEDLGAGEFHVVVWDKTNVDIASSVVLPSRNELRIVGDARGHIDASLMPRLDDSSRRHRPQHRRTPAIAGLP